MRTSKIAPFNGRDWYTLAVSQSETERTLYVYSLNYDKTVSGNAKAKPVGTFSAVYFYPKL